MYRKVVTLFQQNLGFPSKNLSKTAASDVPNVTLMAQDLLVLLLPCLSTADCKALWDLCASNAVVGNADAGIQKRGYRIMSKLVQSRRMDGRLDIEAVLSQLEEVAVGVGGPAKRVSLGFASVRLLAMY